MYDDDNITPFLALIVQIVFGLGCFLFFCGGVLLFFLYISGGIPVD